MAGGFKMNFVADVAQFLRGTKDVEGALGKVSDSLDDLARDAKTASNKAGDAVEGIGDDAKDAAREVDTATDRMERSFKDVLDDVKTSGRTTFKEVGDDASRELKQAFDGDAALTADDVFAGSFKAEVFSNALESGAEVVRGFKDGFDSEDIGTIVDGLSDTAIQAGAVFGPGGAAAGAAFATGLQLATGSIVGNAEKMAADYESTFSSAFDNIVEAGAEMGRELTISASTAEIAKDVERYNEIAKQANAIGVDQGIVLRAIAGDEAALAVVKAATNETRRKESALYDEIRAKQDKGKAATEEQLQAYADLNDRLYESENALDSITAQFQNNTEALNAGEAATKAKAEADQFAARQAAVHAVKTAESTKAAKDFTVTIDGATQTLRAMPDGKIVKVTDNGTAELTQQEINAIKGTTVTATVDAATEAASRRLDQFIRQWNGTRVTVRVDEVLGTTVQRGNHAGRLTERATGGVIPGQPSSMDNQLIHAASGEFIVNAEATSKNRELLEAINQGRAPKTSSGGAAVVNVTVNAAPGMDERQLADYVGQRISKALAEHDRAKERAKYVRPRTK